MQELKEYYILHLKKLAPKGLKLEPYALKTYLPIFILAIRIQT
jgi:hypothetical protein